MQAPQEIPQHQNTGPSGEPMPAPQPVQEVETGKGLPSVLQKKIVDRIGAEILAERKRIIDFSHTGDLASELESLKKYQQLLSRRDVEFKKLTDAWDAERRIEIEKL